MNKEKLALALGLCRRAGKLILGTPAVTEGVIKGKARLVLIASDASDNTAERLTALCENRRVEARKIPLTKAELSDACGLMRESAAAGIPREFLNLVSAAL